MADISVTSGAALKFSCQAEFEAHRRSYEEKTKTKFVILKSDRVFGKTDLNVSGKAIHWHLKTVPYDGTPFVVLGTKTFICHQGRDKHAAYKRKREEKLAQHHKEDPVFAETRIQTTKKTGCPAAIYVVHICRFPDYKIYEDTPYQRREKSSAVRKMLRGDPSHVKTEQLFTAYFPHVTEHKNHPIVGKDLVESWRQEGCVIEYRPAQEKEDGTVEKLLLCLQTPWQKRLLLLYGQQMCLLDATYRTSKYSVYLFFLYVRTNVNYIVVGVFVTQSQKKEDIREALEVFKKWNADWNPSHFMSDFCEAEIGALEEVFKDSKVSLCDFHRENAWIEWTRKKDHGVTCEEEVLKMLRAIADCETTEEYENSTLFLKQHPVWQTNERLRRWFSTKWLNQTERWVNVFKNDDLKVALYTNNGVERQNETLRYSYLKGYKNCSLSETIMVIVQDFLPRSYQRYIELNVKCSSDYQVYSQNVPPYLKDKPRIVAEHIMTRHQESLMFTEGQVTSAGEASFKVNCQTTSQKYSVSFGSESRMPSCTCKDWQKNLLPCKHFCVVFNLVPGWSWDSLCLAYRENPLFMLDELCLRHSIDSSGTSVPSYTGCHSTVTNVSESEQQTYAGCHSVESSSSSTVLTNPSTKTWKHQKCSTLLKELTDKVYLLQDESCMDRMIEKLEGLLEDVKQNTPNDGSLVLLYTPLVKKRSSGAAEHPKPLKKTRRKLPLSGGVGHCTDIATTKTHISVNLQ
ncbi:uncharacterized protein si:dkey-31c13.1 isoform X1 [Scomber scombrus]|uniref:uncharacterized protein si:dkey-31c13.1 isoform X1 n=1 Tax=Scomber scombrus TaxID=13677 RepID=UPI002DDA88A3|nr:uncharacterized protein si:dkey-31c13.1 isoform X1 [Scomber scombrus]